MKINRKYSYIFRMTLFAVQIILFTSCYRQEIVLDRLPANTPAGSEVYITGNFNNWDPGDQRFRMERGNNGVYSITLPRGAGKLEYKFTRGDWTTVEKNECGYDTPNRSLRYGEYETVLNTVYCWGDTEPMNCIQKTLVINELPENTPDTPVIYLASTFNGWNPGDFKYIMQKNSRGQYYITLDKQAECMEYKFTLGNWESVETEPSGNDIANRRLCFDEPDTAYVAIKAWRSTRIKTLRKVTLVISSLPEETMSGDPIYAAGSFNNWDPGNKWHAFKTDDSGRRYLTLASEDETITFKITRGNWRSVETTLSGKDIADRSFIMGHADTLFLKVDRWKDR
ncbi:glycogen-binding domain-containing protein [Lentimicrobium sp.]|uniref:glycogen-binding domain-containing protein n=1 Tax=Lentimicrobium sp. TaxID=2034841 RepID=UPI002C6A06B3|nr:glycogen-binding domain-containing protein [Lentimicrobium sp.]HPR25117.1 glycogen-binding domain-containing protein [Lentimicrobium sp.]